MGGLKTLSSILFTKKALKKTIAYSLLIGFLYAFKDFLGIFFLTFIFAYLFFSMAKFIQVKFKLVSNKVKWLSIFEKTPLWILVLLEYIIFIGIIVYFVSNIIPTIKTEVTSIVDEFSVISDHDIYLERHSVIIGEGAEANESGSKQVIRAYNDFRSTILQKLVLIDPEDNLRLTDYIENLGKDLDFESIGKSVIDNLGILGSNILKVILAIVLSFIFIFDRKKLGSYLYKVKESNFGFLYNEYDLLLEKVVKSFGLILKAQSMIAFANACITMVGFYIIGLFFGGFPYILTLTLVVFVFSFVPILGMWISGIPLTMIAYMNGGLEAVILTIMMVFVTTSIEAYYLNPKIVSSYLEVPMSLTFVILIISEHFFGFAGLLIGISMFYFFMGLIKDFDKMLGKKKRKAYKRKLIKK